MNRFPIRASLASARPIATHAALLVLVAMPLAPAPSPALAQDGGAAPDDARAADAYPRFPRGEFPLTDHERASVSFDEIRSGGPPRDGIPAIDAPRFVTSEAAGEWLAPREPVIVLERDGEAKAYPLQILIFHEIVNDTIGELPVAVTFCPLCNASIVFERRVDGRTLDFGTTGRLRNSDLVMYDRQSESWWQQFTGRGIIGRYDGTRLTSVPSRIAAAEEFAAAFPDGRVLSRETGHRRPYGQNPYRGYDSIDNSPFLYDGELDPRLPPMARVLALDDVGGSRLVPLSLLEREPLLHLEANGERVLVSGLGRSASALDTARIADGRDVPAAAAWRAAVDGRELAFELDDEGRLVDVETGSRWDGFGRAIDGELAGAALEQVDRGVHFAFAWLAFEPGAAVEGAEADGAAGAGADDGEG